jgi:hypothetical protein
MSEVTRRAFLKAGLIAPVGLVVPVQGALAAQPQPTPDEIRARWYRGTRYSIDQTLMTPFQEGCLLASSDDLDEAEKMFKEVLLEERFALGDMKATRDNHYVHTLSLVDHGDGGRVLRAMVFYGPEKALENPQSDWRKGKGEVMAEAYEEIRRHARIYHLADIYKWRPEYYEAPLS